MKKPTVADQIELKIRQMKDRYKHLKNFSSENILKQHAIPKHPVNELIRQDLKSHIPLLKMQVSRDISHLQKQKSSNTIPSSYMFPTDIKKIKTLVEYQSSSFQNSGNICVKAATSDDHERKQSDFDEHSIEFLEKIDHGQPSSRKQAENLMSWFLDMKNKYESCSDFESVVILCEQELVKHVIVHCKTRGNLLKMIFAYYHSIFLKNREKTDEATNQITQDYENKLFKLESQLGEMSQKLVNKETELKNHLKNHQEVVAGLNEDTSFFKKKLNEMQKVYLAEQDMWKKQWVSLLKKNNKQGDVINNETYNLAITRLRPDLFPTVSPEAALSESLKNKIESGEEVDLNELRKLGEDLFKLQQEISDSLLCDAGVQTEFLLGIEEKKIVNSELLANDQGFSEVLSGNPCLGSKSLNIETLSFHKETQTEIIDELNDSDLAELQLALENGLEGFEAISEESDQESNIEKIENLSSEVQDSTLNSQGLTSFTNLKKQKIEEEGFEESSLDLDLKKPAVSDFKDIEGLKDRREGKEAQHRKNASQAIFPKEKELGSTDLREKPRPSSPKSLLNPDEIDQSNYPLSNSKIRQQELENTLSLSQTSTKLLKNPEKTIISAQELNDRIKLVSKNSENQIENLKKPSDKILKPNEPSKKKLKKSKEAEIQSKNLDLIQEEHPKELHKKNSEKQLRKKQDPYLIHIQDSNRRGSLPLLLNSQQNNLSQKDLSSSLKQSALSLIKSIQNKKKELQDLEKQIKMKKETLNKSFFSDSSDYSKEKPVPAAGRKSTADILTALLKHLPVPENNPDEKRRKSQTASLLKTLIKDQLSLNQSEKPDKTKSFNNTLIEEEHQEHQKFDSQTWKNGYFSGFARGRSKGLKTGKKIGREEGLNEGYAEAVKELNEKSYQPDRDPESQPFSHFKPIKNIIENVKSNKEVTKIAEFNFSRHKQTTAKPPNHSPDILKNLLKKSKEALAKKAKLSKKMVNKIIANTYSTAISKGPLESPEEILEICYEEFSQRYGLKKVTDRKFMEFLASLMKTKNYRKSFVFIKLSDAGKLLQVEGYSKYTVNLYLTSLHYMLSSKIGITMNYEETDDRNMFPVNRAVECVKDSLEGILDKTNISQVINMVEGKSSPDPQRISNGLVELEIVLEAICDSYESHQKSVRKGVKIVISALGYLEDSWILQCDLVVAVRSICPSKFSRLESEEIASQEIKLDEAVEICVELNVLSESEILQFIKGYQKVPVESQADLLSIVERMKNHSKNLTSISQEKWKERIENCFSNPDPCSQAAVLAWRIYEQELKRIESDYLN